MITDKKKVTKDSIIGDVIKTVPGARAIIQKYFGNGCFTCPGINMESISLYKTCVNIGLLLNINTNKIRKAYEHALKSTGGKVFECNLVLIMVEL